MTQKSKNKSFFMEEPNLSYIKIISEDDINFEKMLIDVLKAEFFEEQAAFKNNFLKNNFKEASFNVHKLKHKIGLLGLEKAHEQASLFENQLKNDDVKLHKNFIEVLDKIHVFLYELKIE